MHSLNEGMPLAKECQLDYNKERLNEALSFVTPFEYA